MEKAKAVIEEASLHKIGDLFSKKPTGLKINETEAVVVTAKTEDGIRVTRTFYFCLKPDGTFYEDSIAKDGSRARRHRFASFIRYYNIAEDVKNYNIKQRIGEWKGVQVEVVTPKKEEIIYVP